MIFDGISDLSGTILIEGAKISADFLPTVPTANQATVTWTIPSPVAGCTDQASINSAYCGIVIIAGTSPASTSTIPEDGTFYIPDATLNFDLHAGDRIGDSIVIGAFYEGGEKARGESLTTSLVVSDYDSDVIYYVTTYAVDCQGRYHSDGIRTYSDDYGNTAVPDSPSVSAVVLNGTEGVMLTDGTDLEVGRMYGIEFDLNENFPNSSVESNRISLSFDGSEALTYEDLINTINEQFINADNPPRRSTPPTAGGYLWNDATNELQLFDGTMYGVVPDVIISETDPADITGQPYWFDETTKQLNLWNVTTMTFDAISTIVHTSDPQSPACDEFWFNGVDAAYQWSGTTWCPLQFFNQNTDPSARKIGACSQFWYETDAMQLNKYDVSSESWELTSAIFWSQAPDALHGGTFWFNTSDNMLRERVLIGAGNSVVGNWNIKLPDTEFTVGEAFPVIHPNLVWYKPSVDTYFQYNGTEFIEIDVLEWPEDPADVTACELWWDSVTDRLTERDAMTNAWVPVAIFDQQDDDPLNPETIEENSIWWNEDTNTILQWNGSFYDEFSNFIDFPTDPTMITATNATPAWYNPLTNEINIPTLPTDASDTDIWGPPAITPIFSAFDPSVPPTGKLWFNPATAALMLRTGSIWTEVPYTNQPIRNTVGELWFDIGTDQLRAWDGRKWAPTEPRVVASLDDLGNLRFTTRATGSCTALLMLVPGQDFNVTSNRFAVTGAGLPLHSAGYRNVYTDSPFDVPSYLDSNLREDEFLFNAIEGSRVQPVVIGIDGLQSEPAYAQLGIGTDGTPDERRELAHSIRVQLGYPVVEVELTDEQIDTCITGAFESLRKRSDIAYRRNFFLLDIRPGIQNYRLTNSKIGFDRIVNIMAANRSSGGFAGGFSNNSVFDQLFSQQLYGGSTQGGFDMTSLYAAQQHLELIEMMFATRLNFHFDESQRLLQFHQNFHRHERILLDTTVDRTEQDMLKDRWVKSWIERFALGGSRLILAEIRGKYSALPGAGGGTSLNSADLQATSAADFADCYRQLDDYVASNAEQYGAFDFVIG